MKTQRGFSRLTTLLSLIGGIVGAVFLMVRTANAQATVSTFTIQVSGSASAQKTGLGEVVTFSGPVVITATVVTDPVLPPGVVLNVDGRGVTGTGNKTGKTYNNMAVANLSRLFAATDTVNTTFAFFDTSPGSYLTSKTGLLTLNLTYNTTTMALTNATGTVGTP